MLRELQLTNFKSFAGEPQTVPFAPVTIFVGANSSGKSNALDALRFLQGIALGLPLAETLEGQVGTGGAFFPGLRGGAKEACWRGEKEFVVRTCVTVVDDPKYHMAVDIDTGEQFSTVSENQLSDEPIDLEHKIIIEIDESPVVLKESLHREGVDSSKSCLLKFCREDPQLNKAAMRFGPRKPFGIDQRHFEASLLRMGKGIAGFRDWPTVYAFLDNLAHVQFINLRPLEMRDYAYIHKTELGPNGENISAILDRICQYSDGKQRFLEWLSSLSAPQVVDIHFEKTRHDGVMVELVEHDQGERVISARSLSDGTLRFMGLLAAMFSVPEGSILLFEEIENGLHPTRIHLLVELFEQVAADRNIQIIATTHSSQVLMGLSEEALRNVVLFARDEEHPGTIVRRLGDLPHFDEVTKKTHIDELFTTGWLEFAV